MILDNSDVRESLSRKAMAKMTQREFQLPTEATEYLTLFDEI